MKNDIVRLVRNSLQMYPWEVRGKVKEQDLLIEIEYATDEETAKTIRDICIPEKNGYTFDEYLRKLDTVLVAILMGIPIDKVLEVIDNRIIGETIDTIIEKWRLSDYFEGGKSNGYQF